MSSVGVDIITLRRMRDALETSGTTFLDKAFTPAEQARAATHPDRVACYAMTFAAKEAIFKTFGIGRERFELTDIEIGEGPNGDPVAVLLGRVAEIASQRGCRVSVSLSCDGDHALAVALLSGR